MVTLTPFGIAMRKLRLDKRLRLIDVADALEMSVAFLSAVETGRKPIPDGLVVKISRKLRWPKEDLALLTRSIDQTRKEVRVEDKPAEERELIANFARQLDSVPTATIDQLKKLFDLKSVAGEIPFERKRRGLLVPPLRTKVIREYAETIRVAFLPPDTVAFPIIEVLEWGIRQLIDPQFVFHVQDEEDMGNDEGRVPVGGNELILRSDVYLGACRNVGRDRFTACHELGHYLMHRRIALARARGPEDKIYTDSEWQADTFAGGLLVSNRHLGQFNDVNHMALACGISPRAASVIWKKHMPASPSEARSA